MQTPYNLQSLILAALLGVLIALVIFFMMRPQLLKALWNRIVKSLGGAVERRFYAQFKKQYPDLAERFKGFGAPTAQKQESLMAAFKRLPPLEGKKLYDEFMRLQTNFVQRHPEVNSLFSNAQGGDPKQQFKAMQSLLNLPEAKRKAISKDLLWAWDQLRGRFPGLVGSLEAAYKKG